MRKTNWLFYNVQLLFIVNCFYDFVSFSIESKEEKSVDKYGSRYILERKKTRKYFIVHKFWMYIQ